MIRVLIVDDSPTARLNLRHILNGHGDFEVIGTSSSGEEAVEGVARLLPDVVTMDIQMPGIGGLEATRRIMAKTPVPIAIVSNLWHESGSEFTALQSGALAVIEKPPGPGHADRDRTIGAMVQTLKQISRVPVDRSWTSTHRAKPQPHPSHAPAGGNSDLRPTNAVSGQSTPTQKIQIVAIGASTGGPPALAQLLAPLPKSFPWPILVVQHNALGFLQNLMHWLEGEIHLPVQEAKMGQTFLPGHVYFGAEDRHFGVDRRGRALLSDDPLEYGVRPAAAFLFRSVAQTYAGRAVAVLLTGMGRDGAMELAELRTLGALTMAQDKESSVVHGMPGEAIRLGGAGLVLPPDKMADVLLREAQKALN